MNVHELWDKATAAAGGLYGESMRFFSRSRESGSIRDTLNGTAVQKGLSLEPGENEAEAEVSGKKIRLRYSVFGRHVRGNDILVFHHGSGDCPYHGRIRRIMGADKTGNHSGTTIIATDSPYNRSKKEYFDAVRDLESFTEILAVSAALIDRIVEELRGYDKGKITVSGISLGGWVANIHHAYRNTADEYRPVFAGAAPDALFLDSAYRRLTSQKALDVSRKLTEVLNFEADFTGMGAENVFPLMAEYDQYVMLDRQKKVYLPENILTLPKGHITGSAASGQIASFLFGEP